MCFNISEVPDEVRESFRQLAMAVQVAQLTQHCGFSEPQSLYFWRNFGLTKNNADAKELLEMIVTKPKVTTLRHLDFLEDVSLSDDPELFQEVHCWLT